jgi:hypothetical protein
VLSPVANDPLIGVLACGTGGMDTPAQDDGSFQASLLYFCVKNQNYQFIRIT